MEICPERNLNMKKFLFVISLFAVFSCSKHTGLRKIVGNWEIRKSEGGIAGIINYPAGNGNIYTFTSGGNYKFSDKGALQDEGSYTLNPVPGTQNWYLELRSIHHNSVSVDSVSIHGNQLVFLPRYTCCVFPTVFYEKLFN